MLHSEVTEKEISITEDGIPILTYCYGDVAGPAYVHPFYAPNGQIVTDDEHTRQQYPPGICFTLGTVNGEELDREALTCEKVLSVEETSEEFAVVATWRTPEPLLIETCTMKVHSRQPEAQVLDIAISLHAPSDALAFAGNIGLGCHAVEMEYRKATDADGRLGESEVNGKTSAWGTLSGITTSEQNAVGVVIFPHPMNGETTFFAEDASFGYLFAQATPFTVDTGATHTLRYRVLAYIGDLFTFDVWGYHQDYIG